MSDKVENSNLYTTRVSGDLQDRLDVYIENSGDSNSEALRHLLDLGLQVEEADGLPQELREELDEVEAELDSIQEELDETEWQRERYGFAAWLATVGITALLIGAGVVSTLNRYFPSFPDIFPEIAFLSGLLIIFGAGTTLATVLNPFIQRMERRVNDLLPI